MLKRNGAKAIDPWAARFYGSEEISLETGREPLWSRYRLDLTDYSRSLSSTFRFLSPSFTLYGLLFAKLDISTSTLTWLKETLSLTYTGKRFAANLQFDLISCTIKISMLFSNLINIKVIIIIIDIKIIIIIDIIDIKIIIIIYTFIKIISIYISLSLSQTYL